MTYYKEKLYKELFENVICLKFSNNIDVPKEVQCYIAEFLEIDDVINLLLKSRNIIEYNDYKFIIGKLNGFWFCNYFNPKLGYISITKQKWDVFQVCEDCNYCKPLYHNKQQQNELGEYKNGFYLPSGTNIDIKYKYKCVPCMEAIFFKRIIS